MRHYPYLRMGFRKYAVHRLGLPRRATLPLENETCLGGTYLSSSTAALTSAGLALK